ncbi:MAG: hypothetical protein ACRDDX_15965 [Cellulosilyticaceae bacterium]
MNYQKLIDEIVEELYRKLKEDKVVHPLKKKMIWIGQKEEGLNDALTQCYEIVDGPLEHEAYECIVVAELTLDRLASLAQGLAQNEEEKCILKALLQGKKVYVLEDGIEYRKYKKTSHKALYTLYSDYENKIKQYGIELIGHASDILLADTKEPSKEPDVEESEERSVSGEIDFTHKRLLLETDLMRAHIPVYGTVLVGKKGIVTPLAEDFIRTHKLKIKRI